MGLSTNLVSGLASGLDWRSMIDQLIAIEHRRVDLLTNSKTEYESKLSEWQSFNTKLLALKTAAEGLKDPKDFYLYTPNMSTDNAAVDAEDLISVTTTTSAAQGSYTVKVTDLATAQKLSSNPFSTQTAELGASYAGDILVNGRVVTLDAADSLADVANGINGVNTGTNPSGVTASIVSYGTNDYRIILTSDTTGAAGISLLNGSSTDLVQKFGWKDNESPVLKNPITLGAQSNRFTAPNLTIKSLLGLSTGEASTGSLTIDGTPVTINLSGMSLTDIKDAINGEAIPGVTASVISQIVDGTTYYRLQIDGTQAFVDESNILNTLGILDHSSLDVTGQVSGNSMTSEGAHITSNTLLVDIDGYNTFTPGGSPGGDYITLSGTDTSGAGVGPVDFDISTSTTVQDLLDQIETRFGEVIAYVTSDGKIRVDDLTGGANLAVTLASTIQDPDSDLDFGAFGAASERKRQIIGGQDANIEIDGVEVTSASNNIDDVIQGVTLNLVGQDSSTTVTLNIGRDLDSIKANIQNFVDQYNEVMSYINTQFSYDQDTQQPGGVLFADGTLSSVHSNLSTLLTQSVWGVDSDFSILGLVGINLDNDLLLRIDDAKLTGYLQTNFNDVLSLFVGQGTTSRSTLTYVGQSRDTEAGKYPVHIDRAATRGTETGNVDLSSGGADETLTITQGDSTATVSITNGMDINDIVNAINSELDTQYAETLVGDQQLQEGGSEITAQTQWADIDGTSLGNGDVISFTGTSRNGTSISGSYTITDVNMDTVQGFLSSIENAYSSNVSASIDTSGRIVLADKYVGNSKLSIDITEPGGKGLNFGTVDVTSGAGDGSQEGRYAMAITATDDGSGQLVLRSDDYGSASFTVSQDTSDNNYDHIIYTTNSNTTESTNGAVYVTNSTTWNGVYGANAANGDTITIFGKKRDGSDFSTSYTYTMNDVSSDTLNGLLTEIENAFSAEGTTVDAFIRDGKIYVEDTTAGTSSISLTLTPNNEGGGNLSLGTIDQNTKRDRDLGLIDGTVTGQDVAGTIDGETATGAGQVLTGDDGNVNTDGLSVRYTGTSDNFDAGTITMTLGVAELFSRTLFNITDPFQGYVAFKQESLQNSIANFETQIKDMEARLDKKTESMVNRFVAMEVAMSKLQSQSNWLAGQINSASSAWG